MVRIIAILLAVPLALQAQNLPTLAWSAYLGQAGGERTSRPVLDSAGNIYITGRALAGLPAPSTAYQRAYGGGSCGTTDPRGPLPFPCGDAFVLKLSADGKTVLA